ncbi:hypothetical protein [Alicyclobacillus ferrooxydans]|nr:hypothetical protein [Alicyclobacillus ferrooxydans]
MEENRERVETCSICGGELSTDRQHEALCNQCTAAWERDVESHW